MKLFKKQRGIILPLTVVSLVGLFIMTGLALDTGRLYSDYRRAQTAVDAAALAGAFEKYYGRVGTFDSAGQAAAADNGFIDNEDNVTVIINSPPLSGFYVGNQFSVEAIINQPSPTTFLRILGINEINYSVRAVANGSLANGFNCVFVLDPSKKDAFQVSSDSSLDAGCGIMINSSHQRASVVNSGSCVKAGLISIVGGFVTGQICSADGGPAYNCANLGQCPLSGRGKPAQEVPIPAPDPFISLSAPTVARGVNSCPAEETCVDGANGTNVCSGKEKDPGGPYEAYTIDSDGAKTLKPGTYCGGIHVKKGIVTLNSGSYILRGGGLRVEGSDSEMYGADVSFYNTCFWDCTDNSSDHDPLKGKEWYWPLDINSSATFDVSAPPCNGGASGKECSTPLAGILFFSDRDAPSSDNPGDYPVNRIDSSVNAKLTGAIYVGNQHLKFHSNASGERANAVLVSKFLEISSNSAVELNHFTGTNSSSPLKRVTLVE